jgi:hypothetical protein
LQASEEHDHLAGVALLHHTTIKNHNNQFWFFCLAFCVPLPAAQVAAGSRKFGLKISSEMLKIPAMVPATTAVDKLFASTGAN